MEKIGDVKPSIIHRVVACAIHCSSIESAGRYRVGNEVDTVCWVSVRGAGHAPPFGGIFLDPEDLPDHTAIEADLVFLHERGHKIRHPVLKLGFYLAMLFSGLATLVSSVLVLTTTATVVFSGGPVLAVPIMLLYVLVSLLVFSLVHTTEELAAELYAFYRLDDELYTAAIGRRSADRSVLQQAWHRLRYPSESTVRYVADTRLGRLLGHG